MCFFALLSFISWSRFLGMVSVFPLCPFWAPGFLFVFSLVVVYGFFVLVVG